MQTVQADYFAAYHNLKLTRDANGVLVAEFHSNGGPFTMSAQAHTEGIVDASGEVRSGSTRSCCFYVRQMFR